MVYTDTSPEAAWRQTLWLQPPYDVEPSMSKLVGYTDKFFITTDIMHNWHLGSLRDLVGSTVKVLCKAKNFYPGSTVDKRLRNLYKEAKAWAKDNNLQLSMTGLKKATIVWKTDQCPELKASASDAHVLHRYLLRVLLERPPPRYPGLVVAIWASNAWISAMAKGSLFLSPEEVEHISTMRWLYCRTFVKLANEAKNNGELLFKCRPKFHHIMHTIMETRDRPSSRNAMWDAVFMDEDFIKWTMKMTRTMAASTAALNVLKRYCIVTRQMLLRLRG